MLNAIVGYQFVDDGTIKSLAPLLGSAVAIFVATGYIALDTAFDWTGHFASTDNSPNINYGLYVLYLLLPLICIFVFILLEAYIVIKELGETMPLGMCHILSQSAFAIDDQNHSYCNNPLTNLRF
jgi:hypothetical protein